MLTRAQVDAMVNDPVLHEQALQRARTISKRMPIKTLRNLLEKARKERELPKKIVWMHKLGEELSHTVTPHVACRTGCSHCCHQSVIITDAEASYIAAKTGATKHRPRAWRYTGALEFTGMPCPFLNKKGCSIYAHRPFACRIYFNLDATPELCEHLPDGPNAVRNLNVDEYKDAFGQVQGLRETARTADIRDFFAPA